MDQMQVTVPHGIGPGMPFIVNTPSGQMQVVCPADAQAGMQMMVNVPMAAPQPMTMAQAVPAMEAQPVVMALPASAAATVMAVPVSAAAAPGGPIKFPCDADKQEKLKQMTTNAVPPALASRGMTSAQWAECCDAVNAVKDAQFFKNCPALECCYFCIPCGPIQCALCLINPVTCIVCIGPVERAKKACTAKCNAILQPIGYQATAPDSMMEDIIIFEPTPL